MPRFCLEPWRDGALITLTEQTAGKEVCWTVSVLVLLLQDHVSTHWHFQGQRQCLPLGRQKIHTEQRSEWIIKYNPRGEGNLRSCCFYGFYSGSTGRNYSLLSETIMSWRLALGICLYMDWFMSHSNYWPSTPPERSSGWRSGVRHSELWENWWTDLYIVRYFQEKILWTQFLHLLITRKALKSFMVMSVPHD